MSSITVRNIEESIKVGLRIRAARHGCSMEQEVRNILQQTIAQGAPEQISFAELVNRRFKGMAVLDLPIPARQAVRTPPAF